MPLNPNAGSFTFSPGAASWTPPAAAAPAPAPEPPKAPEPEEEEIVLGAGSSVEPAAAAAGDGGADDDEDAIDESDPLWIAFLVRRPFKPHCRLSLCKAAPPLSFFLKPAL